MFYSCSNCSTLVCSDTYSNDKLLRIITPILTNVNHRDLYDILKTRLNVYM